MELQGSAALDLRLALDNPLVASRSDVLLDHLLTEASGVSLLEGLEKRGKPVTVEVAGGMPRLWPDADADGTTWMRWVGPRTVLGVSGPAAEWEGETVRWARILTEEDTREVLTVLERRVSADDRAGVAAAREALAIPVDVLPLPDDSVEAEDPAEPTSPDPKP